MKSLLLVACLGALLAGTTALPVIRGFVGIQHSPVQFNYQIPLSMAVNLCGLNARCLLNQNIIGMNHPEVRQEYDTLVRLAVLRELMGMSNHRPQDSSSEEVPEEPEEVPEVSPPEVPDVVDVTHDEVPDTSDSDEEIGFHRVGMIAIGNGLGTRRIIIIGNTVVKDETTDEDIDTAVGTDNSDDVSPTPKVEVAPTSRPTPAVPRIYTTPSPVPEVTTDLTNSIEQNGRGSTTPSSDEGRESLGDSVENTDQVEVFDPARPERRDPEKPQRFADWEKFKYITPRTPQVRQMRWQAQDN